jgi:esterase/lipase
MDQSGNYTSIVGLTPGHTEPPERSQTNSGTEWWRNVTVILTAMEVEVRTPGGK